MISTRFVLKRLLLLVPVLVGVASLVFSILHLSPGDPALTMRANAPARSSSGRSKRASA
ncbi:binding-protein-dependent transporters inner membrane component [Haloferax sp. BAB-2207]|nr:binding-protein-dependent transporters inner membrane component [Haloferax sp. BAB-2207]